MSLPQGSSHVVAMGTPSQQPGPWKGVCVPVSVERENPHLAFLPFFRELLVPWGQTVGNEVKAVSQGLGTFCCSPTPHPPVVLLSRFTLQWD